MHTDKKENAIHTYFNMWVKRDFSSLDAIFEPDVYYSECYGPEYYGLSEIHLWIDAMLQKQKVLDWSIKQFIHAGNTVVVEWFFKEEQNGILNSFDGVSIMDFSDNGKISAIKEFESKAKHIAPYHNQ